MPLATRALAQAWHEQKYAGIEEQTVQLWSTSHDYAIPMMQNNVCDIYIEHYVI